MLSIIKTYLFISDLTYSVCKIKVKQKQKEKKKKPTKINIVFTYKLHNKYIYILYTYIRYTILYIHIYLLRLSMYELLNAHWRCKNSTHTNTTIKDVISTYIHTTM